jgi:hypothetical protein
MKTVNVFCERCKKKTPHMPGGDGSGGLKMICQNYHEKTKDELAQEMLLHESRLLTSTDLKEKIVHWYNMRTTERKYQRKRK